MLCLHAIRSLSLSRVFFFFVLLHSIHFGSMIVILACWDSLFVPKRLSVDKCYANSTTLLLLVVHADGGGQSHEMWFRCPNSRQAIEECPLTHLSLSHTHAQNPKLIGIIVCIIFEVEHALSAHSFVLNRFRFTIYSLMILLPPTTRWISIICTNQLSHCGWFIFLPPTTHIDTRRTKQMADSWWWLDILVRRSLIIHLWMREVSLHDEKQSFCAKQWPLIMWNSHTHTLTADEQQRQQLHPKSRDIIQLFDKQNYRLSEKFCALSVCKRKIL